MARAQDYITKCNTLKKFWQKRNDKFKEWYSLLEMVDALKQENMESFVGNDPRAAFNLVLSLLEQKIPHRIPSSDLSLELVGPATELESIFNSAWGDIYYRHGLQGRESWLRDLIGYLLATGWYSVFSTISADGRRCIAEIWNPATVYPNWDDEMVECAHIFTVSAGSAQRMIARNNWTVHSPPRANTLIYDYWWLDGVQTWNTIILGSDIVKPETYEPRFKRIPIFTSPAGGLPDTGVLAPSGDPNKWKEEIGQSVVATNENIYKSWNKWWTFSMQLLRDTAQSRIKEKSRSGKPIVKPEDVFKRGAIFRMSPEEDVSFLAPPPVPVELRAAQLDMEAMMQRGGPSWAMFGNVQQQLSAYVMSQISAAVNQMAKPYHQGIINLITAIDNFWLDLIRAQNYKPYGKSLPEGLPDDIRVTAEYEIRIPGDLVQRATTARILNPDFRLSESRVMEELFPEIKNPLEEQGKVRADMAKKHPVYALVSLIEGFKEEARLLRKAGDEPAAALYDKAVALAEASMSMGEEAPAPTAPTGAPAGGRPPGVRPEVSPPPAPIPPVA